MKKSDKKLLEMRAAVLKALGHPIRLGIVEFLAGGEQCVCDIARIGDSGRTNVSKHLSILTRAGILQARKEGLNVFYSLKCRCVLEFLHCIEDVIKVDLREKKKLLESM